MGWNNEKKMTDPFAEDKRWVFSFNLKKREWRQVPDSDREKKTIPECVHGVPGRDSFKSLSDRRRLHLRLLTLIP